MSESNDLIINNSLQDISKKIDVVAKNTAEGKKDNPDGLTSKPNTLDSLGKDILDKLDLILKNIKSSNSGNKNDKEDSGSNFLKKLAGNASESAGTEDTTKEEKGGGKDKGDKTPTNKIDIADIKELDKTNGLGFAVLYWKLDEISKKMDTIGEGGEAKKKGGGLGKFFSGLLEGAVGIAAVAVALAVFAGAMMLFSFVDWLPALSGLLMFSLFMTGMLLVAKKIGKEQKTFIDFAVASTILAASIGVFALSVYIAGAIFDSSGVDLGFVKLPPINMMGAIKATVFFLAFLAGVGVVANIANKSNGQFQDFAKASIILSLSLVTFTFALVIVSSVMGGKLDLFGYNLKVDIGNALIGTGIFLGFLVAIAVVARIAGENSKDFTKFATASLILAVSLVAFTLSLVVVSAIISGQSIFGMPPVDINSAIGGVAFFTVFLLAMAGIAILANSFAGNFVLFGATAMLLSISVGLFAISMALVGLIVTGEGGSCGGIEIPKITGGWQSVLIGLGMFTGFILAMIGVSALAGAALIVVGPGALGIMLISGAVLLMSKAMTSAANAVRGGIIYDEEGVEHKVEPITEKEIDEFFKTFGLFVDGFIHLNFLKLIGAMANATVLTPTAAAIALMSTALSSAAEASAKVKEHGGSDQIVQIFDDFKLMVDKIGDLNFIQLAKTVAKAPVLKPTADCIAQIANTLIDAADASKKVQDNGGIENVLTLFSKEDGFLRVVDELVQVANTMDAEGAVVFAIVTRSMTPIVDSIAALVGIIDDAARFAPGQPDADKVPLANESINHLMLGADGKSGFVAIFNSIATNVKGIGKKQAEALTSFEPITNALNNLFDLVKKTTELDPMAMTRGTTNVSMVAELISNIVESLSDIKSKIKPDRINPIIEFLTGGGEYTSGGIDTILNKLADISPIMEKIKIPSGLDANMKTFVKSINYFEDLDKDAFENIDKATSTINKFSHSNLDGFVGQVTSLTEAMKGLGEVISSSSPFAILNEQLDTTCQGMKAINDQVDIMIEHFEKLADKAEKVNKATKKGIFKSFEKLKPDAEASGGEDKDKSIIDILRGWDKDGVVVRTKTPPKKEEKPIAVAFSI